MNLISATILLIITITSFVLEGSCIIGGHLAPDYPFFVTVKFNGKTCGGTIVASNSILTAARCIFDEGTGTFAWPDEIEIRKPVAGQIPRQLSCQTYIYHNQVKLSDILSQFKTAQKSTFGYF